MTWGQLRLQLQTSAPGVSLDLLDEWLNTRYEQVLESTDWEGLKYHATIQTQAAYQSGTDTTALIVGNAGVTGTGTAWTPALLGTKFYRPGDTVIYKITAVAGGGALTLSRPYEGNGVDAPGTAYPLSKYVLMQNIYLLPSDAAAIVSVTDPTTGKPMTAFSKAALDASAGPRTTVNDPKMWAPIDDTNDSTPPVMRQIEFYPPPLYARGIPVEYIHAALAFDGGNTNTSPLPFVSSTVLLAGVRADIQLHLKDFNAAKGYELKFEEELARLLRVEHQQRRVKRPLLMASRFTRHRLARAGRGLNRGWGPNQGGPN